MDWTDEAIARLRALWDEGHSTAEIGRRMQVSKNAVVGKAHRLNLPARPSPIRRDVAATARAAVPRRVTGPTLPPLSTTLVEEPAPQIVAAPVVTRAPQPAAPRPVPVLRAVPSPRGRNVTCCWPIGEPGTKSFRFCEADASNGKPYCGEHAQLAYVKVRDRRDEAVA